MTTDTTSNAPEGNDGETAGGRKSFTFAPRDASNAQPVERILEGDRQRKALRLSLMAGTGVVAAVVLSFISLTAEEDIKVQVTAEAPKVEASGSLELKGLTYKGITNEGNDFIVLAEVARETPDKPDEVELVSPRARVDTASGNPMTLRSNEGQFNRVAQRVHLNGRVVIVRPDIGYTLMTEAAIADLNSGKMTSDQRVRGFSPRAQVQAEGMVINDNGLDVLFTGKSTLTIRQLTTPQSN
ncbi:MAG: LPS export ABC transporter periplasmic protein LptC [Alphaproteobacteria bacterium]|nr:LPS export ABC transporter periplasmic protein LptC [Alphaproteobacteria bacterium]